MLQIGTEKKGSCFWPLGRGMRKEVFKVLYSVFCASQLKDWTWERNNCWSYSPTPLGRGGLVAKLLQLHPAMLLSLWVHMNMIPCSRKDITCTHTHALAPTQVSGRLHCRKKQCFPVKMAIYFTAAWKCYSRSDSQVQHGWSVDCHSCRDCVWFLSLVFGFILRNFICLWFFFSLQWRV